MDLGKKELKLIVEKWDKNGFKLSEIENEKVRNNTAILLENQANYITEAGSTISTDIADFKKIIMPLTRRIFPNLIANDLVSVQPMAGPVGLAYALRFKYKTASPNVAVNTEIGYNTIDQSYTGSISADPVSGAGGVETSAGERLSSVDPTQTENMREAGLSIESVTVTALTRKLKSRWSLEAAQDLKNMHGVDIESEIISMLQYEVAAEIDRELINRMRSKCTIANGNYTIVTINNLDGQWQLEKLRAFYTLIVQKANEIAISSRRGAGNFLICSSKVITALDAIGNFIIAPTNSSPMELGPGIAKVGSVEGRFDVYRDTFATDEYCLVGYKGPGHADAGIVYCPYVPLVLSKTMEPTSFYPVVGIMSRYGIVDNLFGAENYYEMLKCDFSSVID